MHASRTTLADIARQAGVSKATVSLALRGHPRIPATTRSRLRELADQLGYLPDPALSALSRRRATTAPVLPTAIAFLASAPVSRQLARGKAPAKFQQLYDATRAALQRLGFGIELLPVPETPPDPRRFGRMLRARGVAGILAPHPIFLPDELRLPEDLPVVSLMGRHRATAHAPLVTSDFHRAQVDALIRLKERGYRRPGLCLVNRTLMYESPRQEAADQTSWQRVSAFAHFGAASFSPTEGPLPMHLCDELQPAEFHRWLKAEKPDVVLSSSDEVVLPALTSSKRPIAYCSLDLSDNSGRNMGLDLRRENIAITAAEFLSSQVFSVDSPLRNLGLTLEVPATWVARG